MNNFDLRKFLAEGKLYGETAPTEEAMDKPSNIQKLIAAGYSESDAEDFADEFEQGGSKVPQKVKNILTNESVKSKMKMSELKAKIRTEILAELSLNEDDDIDFGIGGEETQADVDFYEGLEEATKDGEGEVPSKDADTDVNIEDKEEVEVDVEEKPKVSGVDGEFLDQLEDLKDEADAMGDNKLERQIDNTITYFTRQHIAKDTNESLELEEAYDELEENLTKDQIQKKYNEMFGKNPQTKFADVAKALNTTEQEIAAALFSLPMFEADELEEADDMALVADLEAELKEGYSEFQRADKGKKKTVAKDKGEEEVYGAGVKKGEEIEKKKLKESVTFPLWNKLNG